MLQLRVNVSYPGKSTEKTTTHYIVEWIIPGILKIKTFDIFCIYVSIFPNNYGKNYFNDEKNIYLKSVHHSLQVYIKTTVE